MTQISRMSALTSLAFLLTVVATAQTSNKAEQVPGYYNPKTHTFQVKVQPEVDPDAAAPKTYTGTLKYEISVKLVTPVATGEELVCSANALVDDVSGTGYYEETASTTAKVSGSTATCTVSIPYAWALADGTTDTVGIGYSLEIVPTTTGAATQFNGRESIGELAPIKVPTTGATTAIPISATI